MIPSDFGTGRRSYYRHSGRVTKHAVCGRDSDLEVAVDVDEDVFGLEVAVDEVHVLHVLETERHLHRVEPSLLLAATRQPCHTAPHLYTPHRVTHCTHIQHEI